MKKIYNLLLIMTILLVNGCGINIEKLNPLASPPKPKEEIKIGISMATMQKDIYKIIKKAIIDNKNKEKTTIIWKDAHNELKQQQQDIKDLISKKVDIIIFHTVNTSEKGAEIIDSINKAKIPVIALDRLPQNCQVDAYVSSDNFKTGQIQARYLIDQLDSKGKVVILKGDKDTNTAEDVTNGNKTELKKYKEIKIVKEEWHKRWSKELAKKTIQSVLKENKDLNGILANNDKLALGAIEILKKKKMNDKVIIIGADASKKGSIAVAKEEMAATVDKMPYIIGVNSLKVAGFIARKEKWNYERKIKNGDYEIKLVITPVKLIDKYNIEISEDRWGNLPINKEKE